MITVEAIARVNYTCTLTDKEEQLVLNYIKDNKEEFEFMTDKNKIIKAVNELYSDGEIELYEHSTETDFSTEEIIWSAFEERDAKEILNNEHC